MEEAANQALNVARSEKHLVLQQPERKDQKLNGANHPTKKSPSVVQSHDRQREEGGCYICRFIGLCASCYNKENCVGTFTLFWVKKIKITNRIMKRESGL